MPTTISTKTLTSLTKAHETTERMTSRIRHLAATDPQIRPRQISTKAGIWQPRLLELMNPPEGDATDTEQGEIDTVDVGAPIDPDVDPEAHEEEIIRLIGQDRDAWDNARTAVIAELKRRRQAVRDAEAARETAGVRVNTALAAYATKHPDFNRTQLAKECGMDRAVIFHKLAEIKAGTAPVDESLVNAETLDAEDVKRILEEDRQARLKLDKVRQERKAVLRELDEAAQRKISIPVLSEAAGLHRAWTSRFLGARRATKGDASAS